MASFISNTNCLPTSSLLLMAPDKNTGTLLCARQMVGAASTSTATIAARITLSIGLSIGTGMFLAAAWLGEKNALYLLAIVLLCAAVANLVLA